MLINTGIHWLTFMKLTSAIATQPIEDMAEHGTLGVRIGLI